jgi:hypothetical protein
LKKPAFCPSSEKEFSHVPASPPAMRNLSCATAAQFKSTRSTNAGIPNLRLSLIISRPIALPCLNRAHHSDLGLRCASQQNRLPMGGYGSKCEELALSISCPLYPVSDRRADIRNRQLRAKRGDIRVAADSYYPRSGGLRPPWLAPARPEHRPAAASQRSLQAYSITSSVATQRALTISVKHDLWRAQCLNVTPTTHPAIGTSIRHTWTARQHGLLRRALSFREVANRSSPASPRRQKSSRWRGEPASYVRPPRLGQK